MLELVEQMQVEFAGSILQENRCGGRSEITTSRMMPASSPSCGGTSQWLCRGWSKQWHAAHTGSFSGEACTSGQPW